MDYQNQLFYQPHRCYNTQGAPCTTAECHYINVFHLKNCISRLLLLGHIKDITFPPFYLESEMVP